MDAPHTPKRRRLSLQVRIIVVSAFAIATTVIAAHFLLIQLFERHVTAQFQSSLNTTLNQLTTGLNLDPQTRRIVLREPMGEPRWATPYSGLYWQIDASPKMNEVREQRSRSLWDFTLKLPRDTLSKGTIHHHIVEGPNSQSLMVAERLISMEANSKATAVRLIVAADTQELRAAIDTFQRSVTQYLAVLTLVLLAVLFLQISFGLAPLRQLTRALRRLRSGEIESLQGRFPSEIQPLADDFNTVLADQRRTIERARASAGNLAHAIRTPLTILTNAAGDQSLDAATLRNLIREQGMTARSQIDWHLKRARMAASTVGHGTVDLQATLTGILRIMQQSFANKPIDIECSIAPKDLFFRGEEQDLQEILGNVIENACKWARSKVTIQGLSEGAYIVIVIQDDGPGVPESSFANILQRGMRMDERHPGSGLGLSIVAELIDLYSGQIILNASPFGGLSVTLRLPARQKNGS